MTCHEPILTRELIGPAEAAEMLKRNTNNRTVRKGYVERLTSVMQRGEWMFNGIPISFDCNGVLQNGQHRLMAIVASGCTIDTAVLRNAPVEAFSTIDTGIARGYSDVVHMRGQDNATSRSALVRLVYQYEHSDPTGRMTAVHSKYIGSFAQLDEYVRMNPDCCEFVDSKWFQIIRDRGVPQTYAGLTYLAFSRAGCEAEQREEFFSVIEGTIEASRIHPARALMEKFLFAKGQRRTLARGEAVAYCVRAFNAFISSRTLGKLLGDVGTYTPSFSGWQRGRLSKAQ